MEQVGFFLDLDSDLAEQANAGVAYYTWLRVRHHGRGIFWSIRAYNAGPAGASQGRGYGYLWKVLSGT
jgi:soluble lytic murein transglycosylase-like protein